MHSSAYAISLEAFIEVGVLDLSLTGLARTTLEHKHCVDD